jgi:anti-sigma B factor antagonist
MSVDAFLEFRVLAPITVGTVRETSVLDAINVSQFGEEVLAYVGQNAGLNLLLNFQHVDYLSSAVLTELLKINEAVKEVKGTLRLCALNADVRKVFEITNLDSVFTIYEGVDQALTNYKRSLEVASEEDGWADLRKDL